MYFDEILVTNTKKLKAERHSHKEKYGYDKYEIVKKNPDTGCCVAIYEIPSGKSAYPYHYHASVEEVFYIISGSGILRTIGGEKNIAAGDVIVCPPGEKSAHKITNTGSVKLIYLDVDIMNFPDVVFYPDSKKIGMYGLNTDKVFKEGTETDYFDGE